MDEEIKLPEPVAWIAEYGGDIYTADQLRAAVEADRERRQPGQPVAFVKPHGATVKLEWASVDAAHNATPGPLYAEQPAQQPLTFAGVAKRKLDDLLAQGYRINGFEIERESPDGTVVERGAITVGGMVLWWHPKRPTAIHHLPADDTEGGCIG